MRRTAYSLSCVLMLSPLTSSAQAQSTEDFYRGKQIRVIVGSNFVIENMPGAGSLIAANYLYNKAPQDGTAIGSISRNIPNYAFTRKPNVYFDPLKFNWIGSPEMTNRGCFANSDSGMGVAQDLFTRELLVGTDGAGTALSETPVLLRNLLGMKFRTVDGYKSSTDVVLAMQRKEVGGICQTVTAFAQTAQNLLDEGSVRLLFTTERQRVPRLKVPTVFEFAKTEEQRQILEFQASSLETGRPILAPPGAPPDRVKALRRAFDATMKDPAFLADAKQRRFDVDPRTGEEIEAVLRSVASLPPEIIAKAGDMTRR
jgi:tripartite-type tricarboxylate transporter receptor subunit TctC